MRIKKDRKALSETKGTSKRKMHTLVTYSLRIWNTDRVLNLHKKFYKFHNLV